jgi:hypothetical protein
MNISKEKRDQLLAGVGNQAAAEFGTWWTDARSAPQWAQDRIVEIRAALDAKQPIPPPTREWVAGAEKRYAAAVAAGRFARKVLAPITKKNGTYLAEVRRMSKETGCSFEDCQIALTIQRTSGELAIDTLNQMRLRNMGKRIEASKSSEPRTLTSDEKAARRGFGFVDLMPKEIQ